MSVSYMAVLKPMRVAGYLRNQCVSASNHDSKGQEPVTCASLDEDGLGGADEEEGGDGDSTVRNDQVNYGIGSFQTFQTAGSYSTRQSHSEVWSAHIEEVKLTESP